MITDASIREQGYMYFLTEAPELLQIIEEELYGLADDRSTAKVHNLMRATHTIKGGAANVGLDTINKIAHSLEDIFKALYSPDVVIDSHLQTLLFQAYECLQLPVTSEITKANIDDEEILQRAATVFAKLQEALGDAFGADAYIPTSEELGFDIVLSIFETGVSQRIDSIAEILISPPAADELALFLRSQAEIFIGLAESLNLPGFGGIAKAIIAAIEAKPMQAKEIATSALDNLYQAKEAVMAGDRARGGEPSSALLQFAKDEVNEEVITPSISEPVDSFENQQPSPETVSLRSEIEKLYHFLTQPNLSHNEPLKPVAAKLYLKLIRYILGWFNHELDIPEKQLSLSLLIPRSIDENPLDYIDSWLNEFFAFLQTDNDSESLKIYRQGVILNVLLAVAKFQNAERFGDSSVIETLQFQINSLIKDYKQLPVVTTEEKNWIDSPKLQKLLEIKEIPEIPEISPPASSSEQMIEAIWGEDVSQSFVGTAIDNSQYIQSYTFETLDETLEISEENENETPTIIKQFNEDNPNKIIELATEKTNKINNQIEDKTQSPTNNTRQMTFVRVNVEGLQRLNYLAGELLIYQKRRNLFDDQLKQVIGQLSEQIYRHQETLNELRDLPLQNQNVTPHALNFESIDFDALEMDDYSEFHLTLHSALEETLQLQEIAESLDLILNQSSQVYDKQQRLTLNIIDNLVEARMAPLGNILNRFPQMVQNLGNVYGKNVEMKLSGTHVLVDKAISEKLYDPLLHLVRNAFDHGIEAPSIRSERGKPETGIIEILAYHQGSQTIIEIRDDGQGLNLERIRKKGIEMGLIPDTGNQNSYGYHQNDDELLELLFSPGFSTASKVSEISGRGIGLDIVQTQLESLNGSITVHSSPNQGTSFVLKLPFSMTTDKLMIVQAGGAVYALLLDSIEKVLLPSPEQIKEFEGRKALLWSDGKDERMVGLRDLNQLMSYSGTFVSGASLTHMPIALESGEMLNPILMLRRNQEILGLEVDQILGEQELVIRPLGNAIAPPSYIYGCTSLANGNLVLVIDGSLLLDTNEMQATLDVMQLSATYSRKKALPMLSATKQSTPLLAASSINEAKTLPPSSDSSFRNPKVVLVVDDAISLRQTISLTLQKVGYQVIQAQNGVEALEQLQRHPEIELIVSDLEMPRMNGFELLSNVRQNPTLLKKPVVILTSRSAEKHRKLAEALGANSYMTKPYLEHEFLGVIDGLVNRQVNGLTHVFVTP
jgi:two-component system, chemotaxis family, sensor histidine kinase and response regulator PixL